MNKNTNDKDKALAQVLLDIEKQFGKGAIMKKQAKKQVKNNGDHNG